MEELTYETAVITDEITFVWGLASIEEAAVIRGIINKTSPLSSAVETAVLTSTSDIDIFQEVGEAAKIKSAVTWVSNYDLISVEIAKFSSSSSSQVFLFFEALNESASILSDSTLSAPFVLSTDAATVKSFLTLAITTTSNLLETAKILGSSSVINYLVALETVTVSSDSQASIMNGAVAYDAATILSDSIYNVLTTWTFVDSAAVLSSVELYCTFTESLGDTGYVSASLIDIDYLGSMSGWTTNVVNWAMSEYRGLEVEEIHGEWGLGRNGVYRKSDAGVNCEFATAQIVPANMYGARCTHVVLGCSPDTECRVSLRAENPNGGYMDYPTSTWPVGTRRFIREFDAPRGVKSPSFGVKIQTTAPNKLEIRSLSITPLAGGRR